MRELWWRHARRCVSVCFVTVLTRSVLLGATLVSVRGVVHDPDHLPIPDASVTLQSITSGYKLAAQTGAAGDFVLAAVPLGEYVIKIEHTGFLSQEQSLAINSSSTPILHFALKVAQRTERVQVAEREDAINTGSSTPT